MHPIQVDVDYVERRSRLTTFFRLILAIPHIIFVYLYGLIAFIVAVIAWFAIVITGRYPQGMWNLVASYLRYAARTYGYILLVTDPFPPFSGDGDYLLNTTLERPERQARLKTLFRGILIIPAWIVVTLLGYAIYAIAGLLWLWIVFMGRSPRGLHNFMVTSVQYYVRLAAYTLLLTDAYPNFDETRAEAQTPVETAARGLRRDHRDARRRRRRLLGHRLRQPPGRRRRARPPGLP